MSHRIGEQVFRVDDLVRFTLAARWNRERDYRVTAVYSDGIEVGVDGHTYRVSDGDAARLGLELAPHGGQGR